MAQVSRPFQVALGAVVVLALVWMMALRGHVANPSEPAPSSPSASVSASSAARAPAAPTPVYHGAAPGVEGLTRAIAKAHGAVALSQRNAGQLQRKSDEASNESRAGATSGAATSESSAGATSAHNATSRASARAGSSAKTHSGRPAAQVAVERELSHGKTVMLVFWNPRSTVDEDVQSQARALAGGSRGTVTLHAARAGQVGMFGAITEVAHVYQTPTILIVNRHGLVSTLTGLTDVFALEQAVREARSAKR
ncbi:MAG TPA: hypothetical protein VFV03_06760 [Solirubrobacteraceae bacterium]|nr:hypothetical protein [Solirubrobacteraceae bacterium]